MSTWEAEIEKSKSLRPTWSLYQVPGQPELQRHLSKKHKNKQTQDVNKHGHHNIQVSRSHVSDSHRGVHTYRLLLVFEVTPEFFQIRRHCRAWQFKRFNDVTSIASLIFCDESVGITLEKEEARLDNSKSTNKTQDIGINQLQTH